jgi:polysaccharide biosynthesis transport protein
LSFDSSQQAALPSAVFSEEPPQADPHAGLSLAQVIAILRYHWKISAAIAAALIVVSAIGIKLLPKTFTAVSTLIINSDNHKDVLAAQAQGADFGTQQAYVMTQTELLLSPAILLPAVDQMHLTTVRDFAGGFPGTDPVALRDYVGKNLAKALQVTVGQGGQLVYVEAASKSPDLAANLANGVVAVYMDEERRRTNGPAVERERQYSADLAELRAKVAQAQDNLAAYLKQSGLTSLTRNPGEVDTENQALTDLSQKLLDAQNQRRALEARSAGERASGDEAMGSTLVQGLREQLNSQQNQLAQLAGTYGPQHPKMVALKAQIASTQEQIARAISALSENASTQLARARDLEAQYSRALADQRAKVLHLRDQQGNGGKLELELESAQSVYKRALDGYDQIMFASTGNNTMVSLLSPATPPVEYTKPKKTKLFAVAILASILFGIAAPVAFELLLDRRVRCKDDIERAFGIPVLAHLGPIPAIGINT